MNLLSCPVYATGHARLITVPAPVPVSDADDPRLTDYVSLTDVHLRRSLEAEHGLFIAEGEKVIRRAIAAGYQVRSLLVGTDKLATVADLADGPAPLYVLPPAITEQLTGYRVHRGALASMRRRPVPEPASLLAGAQRIVVLEDIVDHANVGAVFRCAAGLGFDAVLLAPRCADPLYRRAVKVSMGSVFAVPYGRLTDWRGGLVELRAAGFRLLALTPDPAAVPISQVAADGKLALLIGAEGDGLSARWLEAADQAVRIPMRAQVDSLNVASAAAIACYLLAPPPAGGSQPADRTVVPSNEHWLEEPGHEH
jgi:tRNA G18 (ribose-2'-O)-methylase SpoU